MYKSSDSIPSLLPADSDTPSQRLPELINSSNFTVPAAGILRPGKEKCPENTLPKYSKKFSLSSGKFPKSE